jgi:VanZ family protein
MNKHQRSYYILLLLLASVIVGMLYFGFRLKGFRPTNNVRWAAQGPGLSFGSYGIAYSEPIHLNPAKAQRLSLEIAVQPGRIGTGVHFVLVAHDGQDAHQLLIGQWRSELIVMNGDDYENRRKSPKIIANIGRMLPSPVLISIVSGGNGTRLYLNGKLRKENAALNLSWPDQGRGARLILGNSVYGHHYWRGTVDGLAVYTHELNRRQVRDHYKAWREDGDFEFAAADAPEMFFLLNEGAGELAHDRSGNGHHLIVPAYMKILKKEILIAPWRMGGRPWDDDMDEVVNFIGFWPLGFLLAAALNHSRRYKRYYWPVAILGGFLFSLTIEIGQAWIPSRTSSLLDLILNTAGTAAGVLLYVSQRKWIARRFFE